MNSVSPRICKLLLLLLAGLIVGSPLTARASEVNFDPLAGAPDYSKIPDGYGSTAEVAVTYRTIDAADATTTLWIDFWNSGGYGDFRTAGFQSINSSANYGEVTLTPQAGFQVTLASFQLAGYNCADKLKETVRVENGTDATLIDYSPVTVLGAGCTTHSTFSPNLTSTGPLVIEWGTDWNAGINHIFFTSNSPNVAPEPSASVLLLCSGLMGFLAMYRSRKDRTL